jgi:uncharacterized protein YndB with AHSA1/START domain
MTYKLIVMTHETVFRKDPEAKKLHVTRQFNAPLEKVWRAWTESELLDKWWAPKPWKAETKSMDMRSGGHWLYAMVGPEGEKHWSSVKFISVVPQQSFASTCVFSDENGTPLDNTPPMHWLVEFSGSGDITTVEVELQFNTEEGMQKIIQMGFEGGFKMGLSNLDELLAS